MKRLILPLLLLAGLLWSPSLQAALVLVDATNGSIGTGNTSIASFNINLGSDAERCIAFGFTFADAGASTAPTVLLGGSQTVNTIITNTSSGGFFTGYTVIIGAITSLTGTQSVVPSWTTNNAAFVGVWSFSGCDQSTPFINGDGDEALPATTFHLACTSTAGNKTVSVIGLFTGNAPTGTNQTSKWSGAAPGAAVGAGGDIETGSATGSIDHIWTFSLSASAISCMDVKASAGGGGASPRLMLLGVGP